MKSFCIKITLLVLNFSGSFALAEQIEFTTLSGNNFILEVEQNETFFQVVRKIQEVAYGNDEHFVFEVAMKNRRAQGNKGEDSFLAEVYRSTNEARSYERPLTPIEMQDIRFIVTTLANKSLATIFGSRTALESAGDRISGIHPLRFLCFVFSHEELKVGIHNIRNRRLIWKDFAGGIKESLTDESNVHNMSMHIASFCAHLKISPSLVTIPIEHRKWDELFDILISNIPRSGEHRRYDN